MGYLVMIVHVRQVGPFTFALTNLSTMKKLMQSYPVWLITGLMLLSITACKKNDKPAPEITATATKKNAFIPCKVELNASATGFTYKWVDKSDDNKILGTTQQLEAVFMQEGRHTIELTATSSNGTAIVKTLTVDIVKDPNLVVYYPMGNTADSSGNGKDITVTSSLVKVAGRKGFSNGAYSFNGSTSVFPMKDGLIKNTITTTNKATTISLWFKTALDASGFVVPGVILGYQNSEANPPGNYVPAIYIGTDFKLRAAFWLNDISAQITNETYSKTEWNHLVLTSDGTKQVLYLNGMKAGEVNGQVDHLDMVLNYIGAGYTAGSWPAKPVDGGYSYYKGIIDDVRIYNKFLSNTDVTALYQDQW